MARSTLFRIPALRTLIVTLNAFPIERDIRDVKGVKESLKRLKAGHALLVFPEGTRTRDGTIGPMKAGIRFLAERAAVPIVPVLIEGAYEVWPRGMMFPTMGRINILFGPPVAFGDGADADERLRAAIVRLGEIPHRNVSRRTNVESQVG
jgi:1-acyl-sn-glycerol-3-phosphate acyltransferase